MADRIAAKGVRRDRLVTIPVWSRRDEIYPLPREGHPLRASLGPGRQVRRDVLGQPRPGPLRSTSSSRPPGGSAIATTSSSCSSATAPGWPRSAPAQEREGLDNIRFLDYFPREQFHASLSLADVHLISMRREMTGIVVPGKLYGAMASGRPTLFVGPEHCESADTIRQAELRPDGPPGGRRRPGRGAEPAGRRPRAGRADGRTRPRGVPRHARTDALLRPLEHADRRPRPRAGAAHRPSVSRSEACVPRFCQKRKASREEIAAIEDEPWSPRRRPARRQSASRRADPAFARAVAESQLQARTTAPCSATCTTYLERPSQGRRPRPGVHDALQQGDRARLVRRARGDRRPLSGESSRRAGPAAWRRSWRRWPGPRPGNSTRRSPGSRS